eukprot:gb/GEZN01001790.1/.p1 GENE.gb/GEZN01001790.1/~~gb/GEZN01001790.1/.p1  ORF type:complete len:659 (+),score=36.57 gb/GEZN01001790.1/:62-2038(+)
MESLSTAHPGFQTFDDYEMEMDAPPPRSKQCRSNYKMMALVGFLVSVAVFIGSANAYRHGSLSVAMGVNPSSMTVAHDKDADCDGAKNIPSSEAYNNTNCKNLKAGQTCVQTCNPGYVASNSSAGKYNCTTGELVGDLLNCQAGLCSEQPPRGEGVNAACVNLTTGKKCNQKCMTGWENKGNSTDGSYDCKDGVLSKDKKDVAVPLTCTRVIVPCQKSAPVCLGVSTNCAAMTSHQKCTQTCTAGYVNVANGTGMYECSPDGASFLVASPLNCQPKPCVAGIPTGPGYDGSCYGLVTDESCTQKCNAGYGQTAVPNGGIFTCPAGTLQGQSTCAALPCVPQPLSGTNAGSCSGTFKTGDTCTQTCKSGYKVSTGTGSFTCPGGELKGTPLVCVPDLCPMKLPTPILLGVDNSKCATLMTDGMCSQACLAGYTQTSPGMYSCSGGTLSGTAVVCNANLCDQTAMPSGQGYTGTCITATFLTDRTCKIACSKGYSPANPNATGLYVCPGGKGVARCGQDMKCSPNLCPVPNVADVKLKQNCSGLRTDATCQQTCATHYTLQAGTGALGCTEGTYNGVLAVCNPNPCPVDTTTLDENIVNNCTSLVYKATCTQTCASGYKLYKNTGVYTCPAGVPVGTQGVCKKDDDRDDSNARTSKQGRR